MQKEETSGRGTAGSGDPRRAGYYYAGASRVAMKTGSTVYYLLSDHLGSTSLTTDEDGDFESELRYSAWGGVRFSSGNTPTDYTYTGQYSDR